MKDVKEIIKTIGDISGSNMDHAAKSNVLKNMTFTLTGEELRALLQEIEHPQSEWLADSYSQHPRSIPRPMGWGRQQPQPMQQGMQQPQWQWQGPYPGQTPPRAYHAPPQPHEYDIDILPQINGGYDRDTKHAFVVGVIHALNSSVRRMNDDAGGALLELTRNNGNNSTSSSWSKSS